MNLHRLLLGLLFLSPVAPAAAAAQAPPDTAPRAVRAQVQQVGTQLRWTTTLNQPLGDETLCLKLRYGTLTSPRAQVCVEAGASALRYERLSRDGAVISDVPVHGTIERPRPTVVRATVPLAVTKLQRRSYSWQVAVGANELRAVAARTVATPTGSPTGCTTHGASQVSAAPGHPKTVALTFDDGPGPNTPQILSILEHEHVPATFMVIGRQIHGNESVLRRMLAGGNAIGNHTWDHADISGGGRMDEVTRTQAAIRAATGYTPCLVRPPYGAASSALVNALHADQLTSVLWNVDPTDWSTPGTDAIVNRVLSQTKPGSIILMHDGGGDRSQTVAALPTIIHALAARGYSFATVPQLLHYETSVMPARAMPATSASI